ncbi:MAG: transposase [Candidatus Methylacidiphilaceae bacterium]
MQSTKCARSSSAKGYCRKEVSGRCEATNGHAGEEQKTLRRSLCATHPRLGRDVGLQEALQDILAQEDPQEFRWWFQWADRSRLDPFRRLSKTMKEHLDAIVAFLQSRISNGLIETINGLIQLAKRMARGFRSFRYLRIAAFLKAGRLTLDVPALPT